MTRPTIGQAKLLAEAASALDDMDSTEEALFEQAFDAVQRFLDAARAAVLGQGGAPRLDEFPPDEAWAQLLDGMEAQIREVFTRAYLRVLGEDEAYNVQPWVTRYIATIHDRLRIWPVGAFEEIRLELHEGLAQAETVDQLRDRIGAVLSIDAVSKPLRDQMRALDRRIERASDPSVRADLRAQRAAARRDAADAEKLWHWKARRIARTETVGAVNGGVYSAALARAAATGDEVRKQWLATSDDRVRDSHAHANGQVRALHEPFLVGGHPLQHPGDPAGPPAQVINCRCTMLIHHTGQEPLPLLPIGEPPALSASTPEAPVTAPAPALAEAPAPADDDTAVLPNGWRGILAPLGQPSGDGRVIAKPAKLDVRPLPLPLLAQHALAEGHDGAVVVGLHERVWVENDADGAPMLWGEGPLDLAEEEGRQWARRMADGYAGWVSVDLDAVTMTEQMYDTGSGKLKPLPDGPAAPGDDGIEDAAGLMDELLGEPQLPDGHELVAVADPWRFMSSTLLSQPAFHNVKLLPLWGYDGPGTGSPDRPAAQPAGGPAMSQRTEPRFAVPPPFPPKKTKPGDAVDDGEAPPKYVPSVGDRVLVNNPDAGGAGEVTDVDTDADPIMVTVALDAGGPVTVPVEEVEPEPAPEEKAAQRAASVHHQADRARRALTAAGGPLKPPRAWFTDPGLDAPTPLTVGQDGRVYGHLAVWGTCHTGFDGACVTPPSSSTGYSMFHTGEVETADGAVLAVGKITLGGGHPDPTIGFRAATAHYDEAGTAVAVVRAYEDDHGIVVAGALCPETDSRKAAALRRSPLSGDWRRIGGSLELIAALAVNVPGFPVTRPSLAASVDDGRQMSLVAAGVLPRRAASMADTIRASVHAALDERDRQSRRLTVVRERMAAPEPVPWAKTRALLAAARIRNNTDELLAARAAKAHGYPGRDGDC